jgi:hypothetical protein
MTYTFTADAKFEAADLEDAKRKLAEHFAEWVKGHGSRLPEAGWIQLQEIAAQ